MQAKLLGLVLMCVATATVAQSVYRTVTPDGRVVYSDQPPRHEARDKGAQVRNYSVAELNAANNAQQGTGYAATGNSRAASQSAANVGSVQLFTTQTCGYCKQARAWLGANRIAYREVSIENSDGYRKFKGYGGTGVPLIVTSRGPTSGFSPETYAALFGK